MVKPRKRRYVRWLKFMVACVGALYLLPLLASCVAYSFRDAPQHWSSADRSSAGIAPNPSLARDAIVQVYAAPAYGWRGILAIHTWLALKPAGAEVWERFEVVGWGVSRGRRAVRSGPGTPDARWYGNDPVILAELRGEAAEDVIPRIRAAAEEYPYPHRYVVWPGPNSNTFTAYVARRVPELRLDLPSTAIGKNYPIDGWLARTPEGSGWQVTLFGILGMAVGGEGFELDLLGLAAGVDFNRPALRLPAIGRLGW